MRSLFIHAQQYAEKYLKALLVWKGIDFPKMHDLRELTALLPNQIREGMPASDLSLLTLYAVESRYGFPPSCPSHKHAAQAVEAAERVRAIACKYLPGKA